jgi:hypothetical protein
MDVHEDDSDIGDKTEIKFGDNPKIDWFHFETKMRSLIQETIEPGNLIS